jgi:uncharacterized membrane protein YeaQ/YmgE (transglycosylase-associated protein family)
MNLVIWILAGALLGWVTFAFLQWNEGRGFLPPLLIGGAGGFVGGKLVTPFFVSATLTPAAFNATSLLFAIMVAVALLALVNTVFSRG